MKILKLSDRTGYIPGSTNIGLIFLENSEVILIDSGPDEKHARKLYELLSDYRLSIKVIINTHSHADHIGGNQWLQNTTGCKIIASPLEAPTIRQPLIQAAVLFSGAPASDLMNRFIIAAPSNAESFKEKQLTFGDLSFEILDLPGHSVNQKGILVDEVAFIADTLFETAYFKRQRLPFNYDPCVHIKTLKKLDLINAKKFIGGHFNPVENIVSLKSENLSATVNSLDFMKELLKMPLPQDRVIKSFMDHFNIKKSGWEHFLYRATVNGYLSALYREGIIKYRVLDNLLVWYRV